MKEGSFRRNFKKPNILLCEYIKNIKKKIYNNSNKQDKTYVREENTTKL